LFRPTVAERREGVVAFGTDDPMSRPPVRYPVNHHRPDSERAVAMVGFRLGQIAEGSLFDGDEPERPDQGPHQDR
jgi:hypothetical protein